MCFLVLSPFPLTLAKSQGKNHTIRSSQRKELTGEDSRRCSMCMILHSRRCSRCIWVDRRFYIERTKKGTLLDEAARYSPPHWWCVYPSLRGGLPLRDSWVFLMTSGSGSSLAYALNWLSVWICLNNLSPVFQSSLLMVVISVSPQNLNSTSHLNISTSRLTNQSFLLMVLYFILRRWHR